MRLKPNVLEQLDNRDTRFRLAQVLNCSESTVRRYMSLNDDNLTKAAALKVIREETGLDDSEILEEEPAETAKA